LRYSLLASAGLVALCAFAVHTPAAAADCGCAPAVRAALAKQAPVVKHAPMPAKRTVKAAVRPAPHMARRAPMPAGDCGCRDSVRAALGRERMAPPAAYAENFYDYGAAGAVDGSGYTHHWRVAPQGYVPPMAMAAPMVPPYEGPADLPPYGPMSYAPPDGAATVYADGYGDSGYRQGITVEQQGWIGGVGYGREGGGGGGGGGMSLTLSQPDSLNGPSYNSFGQGYGGDYQSAGQVNQFRQQAFAPPANSGSGSGSK
jgi:hypothetical protein